MAELQYYTTLVEESIQVWLKDLSPEPLYDPVRYIMRPGGKRIRPALLLMAAEMFNGKLEEALPAALAIEIFHNFTLMHDDIMDDAPMRRGASFQRVPIRAMSALGSRAYAAPEVKQARRKSEDDHALAENVADYGLIADAFSVGCTIKVLLTGVPADKNEMEFIGGQDNVLLNILSALFSCGSKGGGGKRKRRYKFLDEVPKPARLLVKKLMRLWVLQISP